MAPRSRRHARMPPPLRTLAGPTRRRLAGQALSEFLAVVLALVPLFLLMPVIAKYQDVAHMTTLASRYAAFDATLRNDVASSWKPEVQIAGEVRRRFFSADDAPIKSHDTAGNFDAHRNAFWRTPGNAPLLADIDRDVTLGFGTGPGTRHTDAFSPASDRILFGLAPLMHLQSRGIYSVSVSSTPANLASGIRSLEPFDRLDLRITRHTSVLLDPWTASGPEQTEARSGSHPLLFPAASLRSAAAITDAAVAIIDLPGGLTGPKLGRLDFWRDVVPADRLRAR